MKISLEPGRQYKFPVEVTLETGQRALTNYCFNARCGTCQSCQVVAFITTGKVPELPVTLD